MEGSHHSSLIIEFSWGYIFWPKPRHQRLLSRLLRPDAMTGYIGVAFFWLFILSLSFPPWFSIEHATGS